MQRLFPIHQCLVGLKCVLAVGSVGRLSSQCKAPALEPLNIEASISGDGLV